MSLHQRLRLALAVCCTFVQIAAAQLPNVPAGSRFVMSHFKNNGGGGDERLYISVSPDGQNWTALNNGEPVWQPDGWHGFGNVVRDPTIIYHEGFYWVAYTSGNYGNHESFGLVKSQDLVNWSLVGEINVQLPGATDQLTWSPVFFRDGDGSVHLFINISPTGGSTYDPSATMRTYETHPLNSEWTVWSTPQLIPLPSPNTNELFVWKEGGTYHGIYVDFTAGAGWKKVSSSNLMNGWSNEQWLGAQSYEGGMILKKADGSGYRFYLEPGNGKTPPSGTYLWADLDRNFQYVTGFVSFESSIGMRNGKMTALHGTTSFSDWKSQTLAGQPTGQQEPLADPDSDGLCNLLEAASGLDPLSSNRSRFPTLHSTSMGITFHRAPWLAATLSAEASDELLEWSADDLQIQSITLLTNGSEEVQVSDTSNDSTSRFIRLRATITDPAPMPALSIRSTSLDTTLKVPSAKIRKLPRIPPRKLRPAKIPARNLR